MKIVCIAVMTFLFFSCKEAPKKEDIIETSTETEEQVTLSKYPMDLFNVFDAHGGLDNFKKYRTLSFDMPKGDYNENQVIDLYNRMDKITAPNYSLGYDGSDVWLLNEGGTYEGKPKFYHNLMFYFYSMPFVFSDEGLNYEEITPLEVDEVSYPGYKISYNSGVGASPKDEYYLHYDAETFQMKWLGYTVTYYSNEPSDKINWINCGDWEKVNELLLPKEITWYTVEDGLIKEPRSTVSFENVKVSETAKPDNFYAKPENAKVITE